MDLAEIRSVLTSLDVSYPPPRVRAVEMRRLRVGGAEPWACLGEDGFWHVTKFQNCPQEQVRAGLPLQVLPADLFCGRLGQLFDPPVCPEVAIVDVSAAVIGDARHKATGTLRSVAVAPGPSFGSRVVDAAVDTKVNASALSGVAPGSIARVAVFQAWLRGIDLSYLTTTGGGVSSIDHGYFLVDFRRIAEALADPPPVTVRVPSVLRIDRQRALAEGGLFLPTVQELMSLPEGRILHAFAGIPPEWGLSLEQRAGLAAFVLQRRAGVEQAVARFCRRQHRGGDGEGAAGRDGASAGALDGARAPEGSEVPAGPGAWAGAPAGAEGLEGAPEGARVSAPAGAGVRGRERAGAPAGARTLARAPAATGAGASAEAGALGGAAVRCSAYQSVWSLVTERPGWVPILQACLALAERGPDFAGRWVRERLGGALPSLQTLVRFGILEKTRVTRGGHRAYYAIPDREAVRQALRDLGAAPSDPEGAGEPPFDCR